MPSEKELLQKELKAINWKEVDEYPSVVDCEKIEDKNQRKQCFFEVLTQLIQEKLNIDTLSVLYPELDTIEVKLLFFQMQRCNSNLNFPKIPWRMTQSKLTVFLKPVWLIFQKLIPLSNVEFQ